jgi:hypothetical protein
MPGTTTRTIPSLTEYVLLGRSGLRSISGSPSTPGMQAMITGGTTIRSELPWFRRG